MEPIGAVLGVAATGLLVMVRLARRRRHGRSMIGLNLLRLGASLLQAHSEVVRERERRTTLVTVAQALPTGFTLVDQRPDGSLLAVSAPPAATTDWILEPCPSTSGEGDDVS